MDLYQIRILIFTFILLFLSCLEFYIPYRARNLNRLLRWPHNMIMTIISNALIQLIVPGGLIIFSIYAKKHSLGLFNIFSLPLILEALFSIIILDFVIYIQHVLSHKIPLLWQFHKVHHADTDLDATSALRFHPIEILASLLYKSLFVILFGISLYNIILFEIILSSMALFNHSNIAIPKKIEGVLRHMIVTPQMHLIHHSTDKSESTKNYGFNISLWDKLLGTYQDQFKQENSLIGLDYYRSAKDHSILKLLSLPFISKYKL